MKDQAKKKNSNSTTTTAKDLEVEADVLFQRLYGKWYAFTVVEDDCLMTEVDEAEVKQRMTKRAA